MKKRAGKRLRRWLALRLIGLAAAVVPRLYTGYMWLVEVTSRHDDRLTTLLNGCADRHDRAVAVLWHQEVFSVAYNYRHFHGHTLASVSDFGRVITAMLERCNFFVIRGGSGSRSRRRAVLPTLIAHMQTHPRVIYGLTVDGSQGPVFRMKPGGALIARDCRAPVVAVRTWYRRGITLNTWDRTQIPLPFNRRVTLAAGPYWIPPNADDAAVDTFCAHLDAELLELTARAFDVVGTRDPKITRWGFPDGWTSRWSGDTVGVKHGPYDLDPDRPPPWAHGIEQDAPAADAAARA
jgi:Kdo2-lipid IVA 3' secondary acyltransferase